jgi:hypothetical protein
LQFVLHLCPNCYPELRPVNFTDGDANSSTQRVTDDTTVSESNSQAYRGTNCVSNSCAIGYPKCNPHCHTD